MGRRAGPGTACERLVNMWGRTRLGTSLRAKGRGHEAPSACASHGDALSLVCRRVTVHVCTRTPCTWFSAFQLLTLCPSGRREHICLGPSGVLRVARLGAVAGGPAGTQRNEHSARGVSSRGPHVGGEVRRPRPDSSSSPDHPTLTTQTPQQCAQPQGGTRKGPSASRHSHRIHRSAPHAGDGGAACGEPSSDRRSSRAARQEVLTRKLG